MTKGRKKIPDELKSLRGTDQPCRMESGKTPTVTSVVSLPRSGLKGTAKKVFEVVATELIHNRLLDLVGVDLVVAYAREMGLYHDMMRAVEKEGYTIEVATKSRHYDRRQSQTQSRRISPCQCQVAGFRVRPDTIKPSPCRCALVGRCSERWILPSLKRLN